MLEQTLADPRTTRERVADFTDSKLAGLYHAIGVLQASDEELFSRDHVLNAMRAAYWYGATDRVEDPEGTGAAMRLMNEG